MILVIRTMELFRVFDIIYIMMTWQINVLSIYTYQLAFNFSQFGKGSAIGFLVGIIIGALAIVYMRFLYTEEVEQ